MSMFILPTKNVSSKLGLKTERNSSALPMYQFMILSYKKFPIKTDTDCIGHRSL